MAPVFVTGASGFVGGALLDRLVERGDAVRALARSDATAAALAARGADVVPRGPSTLVSWHAADCEGDARRLAEAGIVVRYLPGRGMVRASVGAWSSEEEVERVAAAALR